MVPPLPNELVQNILKHAVDSYIDWDSPELDILAADASIRELLLAASLVSPIWRTLAQDLLLRRVGVTLKNHQEFIRRIKERGVDFASSFRSLRVIGAHPIVDAEDSDDEEAYDDMEDASELLNNTMAVLPGVKAVELIQVLAVGNYWVLNSTHLRNLHLIDSGFIRGRNEESRQLSLDLLTLSSTKSSVGRIGLMGATITSLDSRTTFKTLRYGDLEFGIQGFLDIVAGGANAMAGLTNLVLGPYPASSRISSHFDSPWTHFDSLESLSASFAVLLDSSLSAPRRLAPPHPLPPTLRTLILIPNSSTRAKPTSSPPAPQVLGRSLADATAILLATIKDLPNLEELAVEDALHEWKLKEECEARGIRLSSSVSV
ncbi:hypothetical protein BCR35DRAFT_303658 [Leucosporidium creatinivorum]|uniref:F-box domain-containing protein n=1 Tax=Leucosporidium creatinivorum TaxID=106004 RepID=A0A1Y2FGF5_9BASI|nr:hypothetical protein BCR35DRAFT_303658 [Leucosporidium creatinivorum]